MRFFERGTLEKEIRLEGGNFFRWGGGRGIVTPGRLARRKRTGACKGAWEASCIGSFFAERVVGEEHKGYPVSLARYLSLTATSLETPPCDYKVPDKRVQTLHLSLPRISTPRARAKLRNHQHPRFERAQSTRHNRKRWLFSVKRQLPLQAPLQATPAKTSRCPPAKYPATAYLTFNSRRPTISLQWEAGTRRSTSTRSTATVRKESGCSNARVMFWVWDGQRYVY